MSAPEEGTRGAGTRQRILRSALALARTEGLEALTIGRLAGALSLSKAGLFGHFGSKEELQLATLEAAGVEFTEQVVLPAARLEPGLPRLFALLEGWFGYADRSPGGCFFFSVAAEFDARTGPIHERAAHLIGQWWNLLTQLLEEAQRLGQISGETPARELCMELYGIELASNLARQLLGDANAMQIGQLRVRARLLREARAAARPRTEPSNRGPARAQPAPRKPAQPQRGPGRKSRRENRLGS